MSFVTYEGIRILTQKFNIMQKLFRAGRPANQVQIYMSSIGQGLRRTTVLVARRAVLGVMKKERYATALGPTEKPKKGHLVEMEWGKPERYKAFGELTFFNPDTGMEEQSMFSYYSDTLPDKAQILAKLSTDIMLGDSFPGATLISADVKQFAHRKGSSY